MAQLLGAIVLIVALAFAFRITLILLILAGLTSICWLGRPVRCSGAFATAAGIERKLSPGSFADVTLSQAHRRRDEAKGELEDGIDPAEEKRRKRLQAALSAKTASERSQKHRSRRWNARGVGATIKKALWFLELLGGISRRT